VKYNKENISSYTYTELRELFQQTTDGADRNKIKHEASKHVEFQVGHFPRKENKANKKRKK
jgi:hypothetical protein